MQPSVLKLEYQFSGRRFFDVFEASALRTALEWFGECQELISGEGVSPSLSPRRLRAKYTLRTKLRFVLRGFRPAGGKFAQAQIYSPKEPDCIYPCRPKDGAHGCCCCRWLHFRANTQQHLRDFAEVPLRLSESGSREPPGYGHRFGVSRLVTAAHIKATASDYPPKEGRTGFVKRNSFIEMAKLHDLSGRITYILSHAKQEHLYEVYATEQDRTFWRELAKCNQEEFEKKRNEWKVY